MNFNNYPPYKKKKINFQKKYQIKNLLISFPLIIEVKKNFTNSQKIFNFFNKILQKKEIKIIFSSERLKLN
jgi:RNase H-fold protein (predicted Holliday junction resolvase)